MTPSKPASVGIRKWRGGALGLDLVTAKPSWKQKFGSRTDESVGTPRERRAIPQPMVARRTLGWRMGDGNSP